MMVTRADGQVTAPCARASNAVGTAAPTMSKTPNVQGREAPAKLYLTVTGFASCSVLTPAETGS
jgi:hypothetical protein